jgi:hypothetical protein
MNHQGAHPKGRDHQKTHLLRMTHQLVTGESRYRKPSQVESSAGGYPLWTPPTRVACEPNDPASRQLLLAIIIELMSKFSIENSKFECNFINIIIIKCPS